MAAIQQISIEKGIPEERIIETVEAAIAAAYRKDYGNPGQTIRVKLDAESTDFTVYQVWEVVENEEAYEEPERQILLEDARKKNPSIQVGEEIIEAMPYRDDFGRIAAQTAKQVIVQRIREAERDILYEEFKDKEYKLINGWVQQIEGDTVVVSLGKVNAYMPLREQVRDEYYSTGQRIKVLVKEVNESSRGPQIIVSRADARFIQELFRFEVPEIQSGAVEIKSISREAGSRTKMAVYSSNPSLDPVGSCVGQRGTRVQAVLAEIGDEKIDIILWDENTEQFIRNALSPAHVRNITLDTERGNAQVQVDPDQLSLAIGKGGQNVRLASKLTGFTLDILRDNEPAAQAVEIDTTEKESETVSEAPAEEAPAEEAPAEEAPAEEAPAEA
jgi:N utilization substance protein A